MRGRLRGTAEHASGVGAAKLTSFTSGVMLLSHGMASLREGCTGISWVRFTTWGARGGAGGGAGSGSEQAPQQRPTALLATHRNLARSGAHSRILYEINGVKLQVRALRNESVCLLRELLRAVVVASIHGRVVLWLLVGDVFVWVVLGLWVVVCCGRAQTTTGGGGGTRAFISSRLQQPTEPAMITQRLCRSANVPRTGAGHCNHPAHKPPQSRTSASCFVRRKQIFSPVDT